MGKSSGSQTSTSTTSPPPSVLAAYNNVVGQAQNVAATPYSNYSGQIVAGLNPTQNTAFGDVANAQGVQQPYLNSAQQDLTNSTQPIWNQVQQFSPQNVQQYQSPYTQDVLNSTMAAENNQDAQQQQQVVSNAVSSGAWGGDRSAVAQAQTAGQQAIANNQTNAGIENAGYTQALGEFNTQQQQQLGATEAQDWLGSQGAFAENNLGTSALNNDLSSANALLGVGNQQQSQSQSELNVPYEEFLAQQAYPFQTTQYLANIVEGIGGEEGGTSSTTQPAPNSILKRGGGVRGYDTGGDIPYGNAIPQIASYVPAPVGGSAHADLPQAPQIKSQPSGLQSLAGLGNEAGGLSKLANGAGGLLGNSPTSAGDSGSGFLSGVGSFGSTMSGDDAAAYNLANGLGEGDADFAAAGDIMDGSGFLGSLGDAGTALMALFAAKRGGAIKGYDDGGGVGGLNPSAATSNPNTQAYVQKLQGLSTEQLQELSARMPPNSQQGQIIKQVAMKKQTQPNAGLQQTGAPMGAVAPATGGLQIKSGGRIGYDDGGGVQPGYGSATDNDFSLRVPDIQYNGPDPTSIPSTPTSAPKVHDDDNGMMALLNSAEGNAPSTSDTGTAPTSAPEGGLAPSKPSNKGNSDSVIPDTKPSVWQSLLVAGLGAAAGNSPYILQNIARGGLEGVEDYGAQTKLSDENIAKNRSADLDAQKLHEEIQKDANTAKYQAGIVNDRGQGKYTYFSGTGTDANGNTVPGTYRAPTTGDSEPQFIPGVTMNGINRRGQPSDSELNKSALYYATKDPAYAQAKSDADRQAVIDKYANQIKTGKLGGAPAAAPASGAADTRPPLTSFFNSGN